MYINKYKVDEIINPLPKNNTKENSWKIHLLKFHFYFFYNTLQYNKTNRVPLYYGRISIGPNLKN
jgi:hypothetical protein